MTSEYVELHSASAFSFLQGASQPEKLVERAVEVGMPAVALLDHNGVYGSARFHTAAKRNGIRAHIGAEIVSRALALASPLQHGCLINTSPSLRGCLSCASRGRDIRTSASSSRDSSCGRRSKGDGSAKLEELQEYSGGLICLTGGDEGPLAAALARGGEDAGRDVVERLVRVFGPQNVYVELQRHHEREEEWRNQAAIRIARSLKLPLLATNGVRYAHAYDREILDLFTSIRNHTELDLAGRLLSRTANVIFVRPRRWRRCFVMCTVLSRTQSSCLAVFSFSWATWDMSFHAIRCRKAKRWTASSGSA